MFKTLKMNASAAIRRIGAEKGRSIRFISADNGWNEYDKYKETGARQYDKNAGKLMLTKCFFFGAKYSMYSAIINTVEYEYINAELVIA